VYPDGRLGYSIFDTHGVSNWAILAHHSRSTKRKTLRIEIKTLHANPPGPNAPILHRGANIDAASQSMPRFGIAAQHTHGADNTITSTANNILDANWQYFSLV
jgi:hypothetical protein